LDSNCQPQRAVQCFLLEPISTYSSTPHHSIAYGIKHDG
jgi:hypothetical protein